MKTDSFLDITKGTKVNRKVALDDRLCIRVPYGYFRRSLGVHQRMC